MPPIAAERSNFFNRVAAARSQAPKHKFSVNNSVSQRNLISAKDMEEHFERHEDGGRTFRIFLGLFVVGVIVLLALMKFDVEYNVVPQLADQSTAEAASTPIIDPLAAKYFEQLKVSVAKREEEAEKALSEKEKRRERWRMRKAAKAAYEGHEKEHTAVQFCGRACEAGHKQMQLAYHIVNAKVDRDLYKVLGVDNKASTNRDTLTKKYEELKSQVREENDEDTEIALAELKDAVEILANPETRAYYNLYGERPPEEMKKTTARHGGWGQEFAFARVVHTKILMQMLKYFDSYWLDIGILVSILGFVVLIIWSKFPELMAMVEKIEAHEAKMKEMSENEKNE